MQSWMIGSVLGGFSVGWWPQLLPLQWLLVGLIPALLLVRFRPGRVSFVMLGLCCGVSFAHFWGARLLESRLPLELEARPLQVQGLVLEAPQRREVREGVTRQRFKFALQRVLCGHESAACPRFSGSVLLSYYGEQQIHPGELWQFDVRLKRPWGLANPDSFNMQSWLAQHAISATAYARRSGAVKLSTESPDWLLHQRARDRINRSLELQFQERPALGVIKALVTGDRSSITHTQWQWFQEYGLNHLVVISGLHVGMLALLGLVLGRSLGRVFACCRGWLDAPRCGHLMAMAFALAYSAMAGFALPTVRALVMLGALQLALLQLKSLSPWRSLLLALFAIVLLQPLATHGPGFWLTFGAVAMIFLLLERLAVYPAWRQGLFIQIGLSLMLGWCASFWFGGLGWIAPFTNLIAVPVVSFFIAPLSLLGAVLLPVAPIIAAWVWECAAIPVTLALDLAERTSAQTSFWWPVRAQLWQSLLVVVALFLWARLQSRWRWVGMVVCGLVLVMEIRGVNLRATAVSPDVIVFDVGQGLSVLLDLDGFRLLYDTGAGDPNGPNMATSVVIPYLQKRGIRGLDVLVLSHSDQDHASGAAALLKSLEVGEIWYGEKAPGVHPRELPCVAGAIALHGRARLTQLHPAQSAQGLSDNDLSCVLMLEIDGHRLLLSGDIEKGVEHDLVDRLGDALAADILLAPHHGSLSSSSPALLNRVRPDWVVVSAGYRNRFGHPHEAVVARLQARDIAIADTASWGAVMIELEPLQSPRLSAWRRHQSYYWH